MELIGKGPGRKGAVWVAMRLPDDCITAYANASRIRQFPQAKKPDKMMRRWDKLARLCPFIHRGRKSGDR